VVQAERAAQAAAVAALTGGADPASVGEPARRTGQEIARWTVPLLRWAGEP
jgi:hypothetical protein